MKYRLTPYTIFEQGGRDYQEDYMCPKHNEASKDDRVFVLCDGMGGHSAGEVASRIVCETMSASVKKNCPDPEGSFSDDILRQALSDAYDVLDDADDGAVKKMGTTMTFLKFHSEGCTIAHIGDSRVYHIRPGKTMEETEILFQTEDHSLVNDLVRIGEMTREEARTSRQKNVITRAIQPNTERRSSADIHHISDILPGDYFLMCSDGILENMEDNHIRNIFSEQGGDALTKVDIITKATTENRDNHSAFIIRIDEVGRQSANIPEPRPQKPVQDPAAPAGRKPSRVRRPLPVRNNPPSASSSGGGYNIWIVLISLLLVAGLCAWFVPNLLKKSDKDTDKDQTTEVSSGSKPTAKKSDKKDEATLVRQPDEEKPASAQGQNPGQSPQQTNQGEEGQAQLPSAAPSGFNTPDFAPEDEDVPNSDQEEGRNNILRKILGK